MSENGFFRYTGKLESLPCLVEDFVYLMILIQLPKQHINAGLNNLFGEIMWFFYPSSGSGTVNRIGYIQLSRLKSERPVWTTGTLARSAWQDSAYLVNLMQQNMIQVAQLQQQILIIW